MKATGIVRRIDDLGRVVIPKEIRRTQHIRQGMPLEIFTSGDGEVIFKKYSPMGELATLAQPYGEVLSKNLGVTVAVCDREHIVAAAGAGRRELDEAPLQPEAERLLERRRLYTYEGRGEAVAPCRSTNRHITALMPIISGGDLAGGVLLLGNQPGATAPEDQLKALQIAAAFLAKQLEE